MPLIPFPDVPQLPGVPAIPRLPSTIGGAIASVAAVASAASLQPADPYAATPWQITDDTGNPLVVPDSVVEFEYRGEMRVADHPVEQGSFASYNKVIVPFDARLTISCGGRGAMTREAFLSTLQSLRLSLQLVTLVTPDAIYPDCNLVHVDYRRTNRHGVSLLLAQLWFQEIRVTGVATVTTVQPSGASPTGVGDVSPQSPTPQQSQAIGLASPGFGYPQVSLPK